MSSSTASPATSEDSQRVLKPDRALRTCYTLYLLIIVWVGILPWLLPLAFSSSPPLLTLAISLPLLLACAIVLWWIGAYFRSISYHFTTSAIIWERGVWFRRSGTIPYRRITAVTVTKGPLSRFLGISRITVQTDAAAAPDLHIDGIREPELLWGCIMRMIQEDKASGAATGMYHEDDTRG
jgi:membrane protein YdbS with pleckstrin-like domain